MALSSGCLLELKLSIWKLPPIDDHWSVEQLSIYSWHVEHWGAHYSLQYCLQCMCFASNLPVRARLERISNSIWRFLWEHSTQSANLALKSSCRHFSHCPLVVHAKTVSSPHCIFSLFLSYARKKQLFCSSLELNLSCPSNSKEHCFYICNQNVVKAKRSQLWIDDWKVGNHSTVVGYLFVFLHYK